MALAVGAAAPDFTLPSGQGPVVSLADFRGRRAVLVVFYPFAFSSTCTAELDDIRDHLASFAGVELLAVSVDTKYSLRMFAKWHGYEFPLLSDFWPHGAVASDYGVFDAARGMAVRGTFLIDATGRVRFAEINDPGDIRDQNGWRAAIEDLVS
jgi:peroxiredoxin (alkyl hydroperoxide reductase subunit C)